LHLFFSVIDQIFLKDQKKRSQFGQHVQNGRPVNTVTASFNIIMKQMTKIS